MEIFNIPFFTEHQNGYICNKGNKNKCGLMSCIGCVTRFNLNSSQASIRVGAKFFIPIGLTVIVSDLGRFQLLFSLLGVAIGN